MADIIFINRESVKWNDTFDSYLINSNVGGDTEAGASLTLGNDEVLSSTNNVVSTASTTILTTGIAELLASSNSITSSTPAADLTLGIVEVLTSTINPVISISGWVEMGVATDVDGVATCVSTTTTTTELSLGIVEVVSSTVATTSVTAGPLLAIGQSEALTSSQTPITVVNGLLDLGVSELLASTSINASTSDAWLEMGIVESLSATATCVVAETDKELTMGEENPLSTGVVIQSVATSLLDLGVSELLASTGPISSTVSAAVLNLGIGEDLTSTINVVSILSVPDLVLGQTEVLTATITTVIPVSIPQLVIGIQEATASTGAIVSTVLTTELTMGEATSLTSTINLESVVSSFLNIGVTEVLEATVTPTTTSGGAAADLILGQQELLAGTRATVSTTIAELTLGIDTELSRRFSNPPFTADDVTDDTVVLINFDGNLLDESGNDFDASLYGDAVLTTGGIYGSSGSVKVYEDPVLVGGSGSDLFDWGGNDFCIEVAFKDTTSTMYNNNGAGNYIIKKGTIPELNDHMAFYYIYQSSSVVRFTWTTWEDHDGFGYSSDIVFDYPRALLQYWRHVTINRINNEIFIKFNGSDNDFTYYNNANTLNGWPDIKWDNLELGGFQSSISNPRFSIDALRITNGDAIYPADNFDLFQDKDVYSVATAGITLGLAEVLASTDSNGSNVTADLELGVEVPATSSSGTQSLTSVPNLILGIIESLSSTIGLQTNADALLVMGQTELLASTIANTSTATDSALIIGGSEILASTGGVQITSLVGVPNLVLGITEILTSTSANIITVADITLFSGGQEILESPVDITSDVSVPNLILGHFEYLSSTQNTISTVSTSALILGVTEDLSSSIGPIGTVSTSLLDLGVTEVLADVDNALSSTVTGDLTLGGGIESLAHTLYEFTSGPLDPYAVSTTPLATMDLGVDEILGTSQSTTSITTAILTIGAAESLSSTINITSTEDNDITMGIVEELSNECVCWVSVSGLLVVGLTEILSSTSITNSVADAEISFGVPEPLSHSIAIAAGIPLNKGSLFIDGESVIQDETATHTITPQGGTAVSTDEFKHGESSIYYDGDGDGMTIPDHTDFDVQSDFTFDTWVNVSDFTNWDRLFLIQNDEDNYFQVYIYDNKIVCRLSKSGTLYDGILSGTLSADTWYHIAFTHDDSTNGMKMFVDGTEVTSTHSIALGNIDYFNGYLDNIRWDKGSITWTSNFDSDSDSDLNYEIAPQPGPYAVSNVDVDLTHGHIEELSHSVIITTEADALTMVTGVAEVLAVASFSVSITTADLNLGVDEPLSATINTVSNISSILTLGADTILEHTAIGATVETTAIADLGFGVSEYMGTANVSESIVVASLVLGIVEPLSATCSPTVLGIANLGFGIVETASVSTTFTSLTEAVLTIGHVEDLSATSSPSTEVDTDITMGEDVDMTASYLVQSNVDAVIILGVNELLGTTATTTATTDAGLTIGIEEYMTATGLVVSNTVSFITLGVSEALSATQEFVSTGDATPILGVEEVLSATGAAVQSLTTAVFDTGGMEMITSTTGVTSNAIALLDLGVSELLAGTDPIVSNVSANLSLGALEDLSFTNTTNIIGETGNLFIDGEFIIEDENGNHTITNYGNVSINTSDPAVGNSSVYFDGTGDYLTIPNSTDFDFGSSDFTIDTMFKFSAQVVTNLVNVWGTGGELSFEFVYGSSKLSLYYSTTGSDVIELQVPFTATLGTWYHIAVTRDGNNLRFFIDGTQIGTTQTINATIYSSNDLLRIMAYNSNASGTGYLDNLRIVNDEALWTSNFDIETDLDYPGNALNTIVADSEITSLITMGIGEDLASTINLSTESDGTLGYGIVEVLATASINVVAVDAILTLGVDEPLSATDNIVSLATGDLGIPGALEVLEHTIPESYITTEADATSLDTGVMEMVSAFKMIWSQIHTPPLTLGVTELFTGTSNSTSLVGTADLIVGLTEMLSSTSISNSVADAALTLGIGEYISSTVNVLSISDALLSTGDDELLASSIISTGAVAGEMIFGLVEILSATRIVTSFTIGQMFMGLEEIQEGTVVCSTNVEAVMGRTPCALRHNRERSRRGGIFKTS